MKNNLVKKCVVLLGIISLFIIINVFIAKNRERTGEVYKGTNEHLVTIDCTSIIDQKADKPLVVHFEACAEKEGQLMVYLYGNPSSKYWTPSAYVEVGREYQEFEITLYPDGDVDTEGYAYLAFYGEYGTGVIPSVRKIVVE